MNESPEELPRIVDLARKLREHVGCAGVSVTLVWDDGSEETAIATASSDSHTVLRALAFLRAGLLCCAKRLSDDIERLSAELGVMVVSSAREEESQSWVHTDGLATPPKAKGQA